MMPPSIKPDYYQLKFKFFRAEKLPALDIGILGRAGSIDAYIICTYMNKKIKTAVKTQKEGGSIDWDQEFLVNIHHPSIIFLNKLFFIDPLLTPYYVK
jgi:hypothetical protein